MSRNREETIAAGIRPDGTKHQMKRRMVSHDYYGRGTYMLTIVVEGRQPLLGQLVISSPSSATVPAASAAGLSARVELTPLGQLILSEETSKISLFYPMVEVWKLCIMPDHIHMIIRVKEDMPKGKHLGKVVAGFKGGCSRAWWRLGPCSDEQGTGAAAPLPSTTVSVPSSSISSSSASAPSPSVSSSSASAPVPAASAAGTARRPLFESGYCDKILFRDGQLDNWKRYLDDNPRRLALKRLHPDFFTVMQAGTIADWQCQMVGNRFLLNIPDKMAVIVHHAYTDREYASHREQWLACGEAGGVLVSAAIAPREKAVMREAMDRGYRIILVRENGFPPLYKPSGESFEACSEGRLLQLSPWEYHMEHHTISRNQCLMLNRLVETIAAAPVPCSSEQG